MKENGFSCYLAQRCLKLGVDLKDVVFYSNQIKRWWDTTTDVTLNEISSLWQEYIQYRNNDFYNNL